MKLIYNALVRENRCIFRFCTFAHFLPEFCENLEKHGTLPHLIYSTFANRKRNYSNSKIEKHQ